MANSILTSLSKIFRKNTEGKTSHRPAFDDFEEMYQNLLENHGNFRGLFSSAHSRKEKYDDFDFLDDETLVSSSLDIYSSLVTLGDISLGEDETASTYKTVTDDVRQAQIFEDFEIRTNFKANLYPLIRDLCKYGFNPQEVVWAKDIGISRLVAMPPSNVTRNNSHLPRDLEDYPWILSSMSGKTLVKYRDFQVLPLAINSSVRNPYGKSILEPIRKTAKLIIALEDILGFNTINESRFNWLWKIDCTGLSPKEADKYARRVIKGYKPDVAVGKDGRLDLKRTFNSSSMDIALPVYSDGNENVGVEPVPKESHESLIEVLKYFKNKFYGGIKLPPHYFSSGESQVKSLTAMSHADVLLAKLIYRIQVVVISELYTLYYNESKFHGIDNPDFTLIFPIMGTVDELFKYQLLNLKLSIAQTLRIDLRLVDDIWVYRFMQISAEEITRMKPFREGMVKEEDAIIQGQAAGIPFLPYSTIGNDSPGPYSKILPQIQQALQKAKKDPDKIRTLNNPKLMEDLALFLKHEKEGKIQQQINDLYELRNMSQNPASSDLIKNGR